MNAWLLDFLSNLAAGLVGGALTGAFGAAVALWRSKVADQRAPALTGSSGESPVDLRVIVAVDMSEVRRPDLPRDREVPRPDQRMRTATNPREDSTEEAVGYFLLWVAGIVGLTYAYFRYQDTILLISVFGSALILSATFVFLILVSLRTVHVVGILVIHGFVALIASFAFVVDLYLLLRAAQELNQRQLADDARRGLSVFFQRHSLPELLSVAYQLLGYVVSLCMIVFCLWAALGLLARVWCALALAERRRPSRANAWLADTGPRGWAYVVLVAVFATVSLLLTSGVGYSLVTASGGSAASAPASTKLATSAKKDGAGVQFCATLLSAGSPLNEQPLQMQTLKGGQWVATGNARKTDDAGRACAKVKRSDPARSLRWNFAGTTTYAASTSEPRRI